MERPRYHDDPVTAVERGLVDKGLMRPRPTRARKRKGDRGTDAGEGKHPLGATKPLVEERVPRNRAKAKAARKARRRKR